jgi:hypothetical protein
LILAFQQPPMDYCFSLNIHLALLKNCSFSFHVIFKVIKKWALLI